MPSPFNKKTDGTKPKDKKLSRTAVITATALALAVLVIVIAAVASNRAKKPTEPPASSDRPRQTDAADKQGERPTDSITQPETEQPTEKPTDATEAPNSGTVSSKLPTFVLPVSGVLSDRHDPDLQVYSNTMNDYRVHLGIDLTTNENAPVYAAADGKVSKIWVDTRMGYCLAIEHSGKCVTVYKNLAEQLPDGIKVGATVRSGQLIASVGDSAMVEVGKEPHLHFEMTVADLAVDPLKYFGDSALKTIKAVS